MEKYRKCFVDLEQEEKWLNEMADKGLVLARVAADLFSNRYYFEQGDTAYTYRVDFERDDDYINFVKDTCNAEYLFAAGDKLYFRKAKEQGEFAPLYSDLKSRYAAEKKALQQAFGLCVVLTPICVIDIITYLPDIIANAENLGTKFGIVISVAVLIITAAIWGYFIYKTIRCRRTLNKLKKEMKD